MIYIFVVQVDGPMLGVRGNNYCNATVNCAVISERECEASNKMMDACRRAHCSTVGNKEAKGCW